MEKKFICPRCGGNTFFTTAHVCQDWKVDGSGNFIEVVNDCLEVTAEPNRANFWECSVCGTEGVYVDADKKAFVIPEAFKSFDPKDVMVSIAFDSEGSVVTLDMSVYDLYADWMGNCNACPENAALLKSLTLTAKDGMTAQPSTAVTYFEGIMEAMALMWPEMARSFVPKSDYPTIHKMYESVTLYGNKAGEVRYELAAKGFDPDNEPEEVKPVQVSRLFCVISGSKVVKTTTSRFDAEMFCAGNDSLTIVDVPIDKQTAFTIREDYERSLIEDECRPRIASVARMNVDDIDWSDDEVKALLGDFVDDVQRNIMDCGCDPEWAYSEAAESFGCRILRVCQ